MHDHQTCPSCAALREENARLTAELARMLESLVSVKAFCDNAGASEQLKLWRIDAALTACIEIAGGEK